MWMIGAPPAIGYSWTIANEGDATSRGSAPSSAAIARARNVLPAPRSPTRWTTASRGSSRAISRPAAVVSSSDFASQRLSAMSHPPQPLDGLRETLGEVERGEADVAVLLFEQ